MTPNGTAIRAIREARKLSIRKLARHVSRDPSHISRIERGIAGASETALRQIADALGVPVAAINREERS